MTTKFSTSKKFLEDLFRNSGASIKGMKIPDCESKIYEIYCVYKLYRWLAARYNARFYYHGGPEMKVRQGGGEINKEYSYFEITSSDKSVSLEIHMNIHFRTLSSDLFSNREIKNNTYKKCRRMKKMQDQLNEQDRSSFHEIDIILIEPSKDKIIPSYNEIILGIECKHHSKSRKSVIKEILGIRRELSLYYPSGVPWKIDHVFGHKKPETVPARPGSLYWLAHINRDIWRYRIGPKVFGVKIKRWKLPW